MILKRHFLKLMAAIMFLALTACGNSSSNLQLPDDPTDEVQATIPDENETSQIPTTDLEDIASIDTNRAQNILNRYSYIDPSGQVPDRLLSPALIYYDSNKSNIKNHSYLSVIDFSQHSSKKRFFIINMATGSVWAMRVAHGRGSDPNHDGYLNSFSNSSGSNASSNGFYRTAESYRGSNGYSLRLDGLSTTNSRARSRAIVIHGASYVQESNVTQGRSWGCPAVASENRDRVINLLKGGSIIFASK